MDTAYYKLHKMVAMYRTLTADDLPAATADSTNAATMPPSEQRQEDMDLTGQQKRHWARVHTEYLAGHQQQTLAGCREDIASLIQAMYKQFDANELNSEDNGWGLLGYKTFADLALAFGLSWVYEGILKAELKVR